MQTFTIFVYRYKSCILLLTNTKLYREDVKNYVKTVNSHTPLQKIHYICTVFWLVRWHL